MFNKRWSFVPFPHVLHVNTLKTFAMPYPLLKYEDVQMQTMFFATTCFANKMNTQSIFQVSNNLLVSFHNRNIGQI